MSNKSLKKKDLVNNLSLKTGFSLNYSKKVIDDFIEIIIQNIKSGQLILKNFGSFKVIYKNENFVKVNTKENLDNVNFPEAINFTRKNLEQSKNTYHHLGIYCYKKETLKDFVSYNQSSNEIKNRLEQLRALDNNLRINVALAKASPIGVDTEEDFVAIKKLMEYKS